MRLWAVGCGLWVGVAACAGDPPAHLKSQSAEGHAEIACVIATALHREQVPIADDAFVATSSITIEPAHLEGRETRPPERFSLLKRGTKCVLRRDGTGEEWELKQVRC